MARKFTGNRLASFAALSLLTLAPLSQARAEDARSAPHETTEYRFDDELVAGDTLSPNLEVLHVRTRKDRDSLVRVRMDYVRELCKSVESL